MQVPQNALPLAVIAAFVLVGACGHTSSRETRQVSAVEAAEARTERALLTTTVLDAHRPQVAEVEARIALGTTGAAGLTPAEAAQLRAFADTYMQAGRGNLVFSVPNGSGNTGAAQSVAQEAQRLLFAEGIDYSRMTGGAYQAAGQQVAPVVVAFSRYEARAAECVPWSQIDPRRTASNLPQARFGCAQAGNLAAMLVDPGDLLGERRDGAADADTLQRGVDQARAGELPKASGTISGGN
jgi:pilus assembly protein CpaD